MTELIENAARSRFEWTESGESAWADFLRVDDMLILPHVEAPEALRGTGAAGRLMAAVLARARAQGMRVAPLCGYAAAYMRRNAEWSDLAA